MLPNSLPKGAASERLIEARQGGLPLDAETVLEVGRTLGELLAACRAGLATRQLDTAAAIWGTERLLSGVSRTVIHGDGLQLVADRWAMADVLARSYCSPERSRLALYCEPMSSKTSATTASRAAVDTGLAARGVRLRAVYQCSEARALAERHVRAGHEDVRVAGLVPINALVVDDRTAILPIDPDRPGSGLVVISDPEWVELVSVLAEACWAGASAALP
jgi:hypothetical protein